jgi:uncharacterized PurR-regulated membrane protein YhhQ (DUF165 family)
MSRRAAAPLLAVALLLSVVLANWLSARYGLVSAGFGLLVSAGTYAAGLALGLRDALDRAGGIRWVLAAIVGGIAISALAAGPQLATASAAAFGLGELTDLVVWRRLRARGWRPALIASNAVGALVDTVVFLPLAGFGVTATSIGGQFLVKAGWMTLAALAIGELATRLPRRSLA